MYGKLFVRGWCGAWRDACVRALSFGATGEVRRSHFRRWMMDQTSREHRRGTTHVPHQHGGFGAKAMAFENTLANSPTSSPNTLFRSHGKDHPISPSGKIKSWPTGPGRGLDRALQKTKCQASEWGSIRVIRRRSLPLSLVPRIPNFKMCVFTLAIRLDLTPGQSVADGRSGIAFG